MWGKKAGGKQTILMCELAAQHETGLIITLGLLSSPTHCIASLQQPDGGLSRILSAQKRVP